MTGAVPTVLAFIPDQRAAKGADSAGPWGGAGAPPIPTGSKKSCGCRLLRCGENAMSSDAPRQICAVKKLGGEHRGCHSPFTEAGRNEQIRRMRAVAADIRHAIQRHAVLRSPDKPRLCQREQPLRRAQHPVRAAARLSLTGAVIPAADKQQITCCAEIETAFARAQYEYGSCGACPSAATYERV